MNEHISLMCMNIRVAWWNRLLVEFFSTVIAIDWPSHVINLGLKLSVLFDELFNDIMNFVLIIMIQLSVNFLYLMAVCFSNDTVFVDCMFFQPLYGIISIVEAVKLKQIAQNEQFDWN